MKCVITCPIEGEIYYCTCTVHVLYIIMHGITGYLYTYPHAYMYTVHVQILEAVWVLVNSLKCTMYTVHDRLQCAIFLSQCLHVHIYILYSSRLYMYIAVCVSN